MDNIGKRMYDVSLKNYIDQQVVKETAREDGYNEGLEEGLDRGRAEGRAEGETIGIKKGVINTARNMLAKGMDANIIMELTGLTEEEINKLRVN